MSNKNVFLTQRKNSPLKLDVYAASGWESFELIHDDMIGNYFLVSAEESHAVLRMLAKDLEAKYSNNE